MSRSRTQRGDACEDRTQNLSIRSPTLYHYATALLSIQNVSLMLEGYGFAQIVFSLIRYPFSFIVQTSHVLTMLRFVSVAGRSILILLK